MTTTEVTSLPSGPGDYTQTTAYPDGTQDVQTFTDDLLTQDQQLGADGSVIATVTYTYDALRRLSTQTDDTGTTTYSYYDDGSLKSTTDPAGNVTTDNNPEPNANQPGTSTLANGTTQSQVADTQGNLITESGSGVLPATLGYDTSGTGQLTSVTTYQSNTLGGAGAATTNWKYDPTTGQLQSKTYADGSSDTYKYNDKNQLAAVFEPGVTGTFGYNAAGDLTSSSYSDSLTGLVQSNVIGQDDQGRPLATVDSDNGKAYTTVDTYTPQGDLKSETFGSAGNASVANTYFPTSNFGPSGSPDALQTVTLSASNGGTEQVYAYDLSSKRLKTITINGVTLTYTYRSNSNQIQSIAVGGVTTTYTPDASDGSRPGAMSVTANGTSVYDASYGYNQLDQRTQDTVAATTVADDGTTTANVNTSQTYTYDAAHADALGSVKDASGNVISSFSYDGVGNFTGNATLGPANSVNEYSNLTFNGRGDLSDDGTDTYTYDALDRLIGVTPDSPSTGSQAAQYGYDGQGRMLWEDVYSWGGSWALSTTHHFLWSGSEMVAELDANNNLLQQYTWGPGQNGQDQVLAITDHTGSSVHTYALTYDASGNVTQMFDAATGALVASYSYAPYGALTSATGPDASLNPWAFKGYWTDAAAPGIAWAQPATQYGTVRNTYASGGFWMQRDPSGLNGGLNGTQAFANDPVNNIDPNGLLPDGTENPSGYHYVPNPNGSNDPYGKPWVIAVPSTSTAPVATPATTPTPSVYWIWRVVKGVPGAYVSTLVDGSQNDSINGCWDALTNAISGGHGSSYGVEYGHVKEYEQGHVVGDAGGFVINMVLLVEGGKGVITGIQSIPAAAGELRLLWLAFSNGKSLPYLVVNGKAVLATADTLMHAGVSVSEIGNIVRQTTSGSGTSSGAGAGRVTGDALEAARNEFNAVKSRAWVEEAATNPGKYTSTQLARAKEGLAPIGSDGFPMEIHHKVPLAEGGKNSMDNFEFLTRTEHRLGKNYKINHPNLP